MISTKSQQKRQSNYPAPRDALPAFVISLPRSHVTALSVKRFIR